MEKMIFFAMPLAFGCELIDSSLGMGYGTTLTPFLLLARFEPLQVVPAVLLSIFAVIGTVMAVWIAARLPVWILKVWIGFIVLVMGIFILVFFNRKPRFTWAKITIFGTMASFNKGISGDGYGPLVMGGQLLSRISVKNAVGITCLYEGITCLVAITLYFFVQPQIDGSLAAWLMAGTVLSVPLAAQLLKRFSVVKRAGLLQEL